MPIFIGTKWKLESDADNIILYRLRIPTSKHPKTKHFGVDNWEPEGYYSTVKNALKDLVNIVVRESELKDVQTVCQKIDDLRRMIDEAVIAPKP